MFAKGRQHMVLVCLFVYLFFAIYNSIFKILMYKARKTREANQVCKGLPQSYPGRNKRIIYRFRSPHKRISCSLIRLTQDKAEF